MTGFFNAFEMSPVPTPGPEVVAPEPFRGIYAMPMFVTIATRDLAASTDFWVQGLGFIELFAIPGQVVHLRRWAFQDVLLVPATTDTTTTDTATTDTATTDTATTDTATTDTATNGGSGVRVSFSCVLSQLDLLAAACRALLPDDVTGPHDTPWNTRDVEVITPEGARVVLTAAKPFDPESTEGKNLAAVGIVAPDTTGGDDNGIHG